MKSDSTIASNGDSIDPSVQGELVELRATCRQQALVINTLGQAVSAFHSGAAALKAENADLRAANDRLRGPRHASSGADGRLRGEELAEAGLVGNPQAPGAARRVIAGWLRDRVSRPVLNDAQLVISELVTNSVRHCQASPEAVIVVRAQVTRSAVRLEVQDAGEHQQIVARPPDLQAATGFGLNLVQTLSERWGVERNPHGGTRVWAQLARAPDAALAPTSSNGAPARGIS